MQWISFEVYFSVIEDSGIGLESCICKFIGINYNLPRLFSHGLAGGLLGDSCFFLGPLPSNHDCGAHSRHLFFAMDLCDEIMNNIVKGFVQYIGRLDETKQQLEINASSLITISPQIIPLSRWYRQDNLAGGPRHWNRSSSESSNNVGLQYPMFNFRQLCLPARHSQNPSRADMGASSPYAGNLCRCVSAGYQSKQPSRDRNRSEGKNII